MSTTTADQVRRSVEVRVGVDRAWAVFTEGIASWWPLVTHSLGAEHGAPPDTVVLEGRLGGAIYEVAGHDRCEWGVIAAWEPPTRITVDWFVGNDTSTRWTATFTATELGTRVDLVHSGFDALGIRAAGVRSAYGSDGGWTLVLAGYSGAANTPGPEHG